METILILATVLLLCAKTGLGSEDELRLINYLFEVQGYNALIRPVNNISEKIKVEFGVAVVQLINVDERNQVMKSNVWLRLQWYDHQLQWDPAEYGGITVIRIAPERVWNPDIVLFNNANGKYEVTYKSRILVYHTGQVQHIPPAIYESSCRIDVKFFPFDDQNCTLNFGSWTFNADQVSLAYYEGKQFVDLNDYLPSGTWDIMDCPGEIETWKVLDRDGTTARKTQIVYTLSIRRKTLFYTVNLIMPCVLISFLTVSVFYLPAEAHEKITLSISILFALTVFLLLVQKILPPTSDTIPLIAYYLLLTFILNITSIFSSVIIVNWSTRTPRTHRMAKWVRVLFLSYLPNILMMKRPNHRKNMNKKFIIPHMNANNVPPVDMNQVEHIPNCPLVDGPMQNYNELEDTNDRTTLLPIASKACMAVDYIASHLKNEDLYEDILEDWKYVGLVIDRMLLLTFLFVTIGGTMIILIKNPHLFESVDQEERIEQIKGKAVLSAAKYLAERAMNDLRK